MNNSKFVQNLYIPAQPAEDASDKGKLFYKEYTPTHLLRPFIHCFWELKTKEKLSNYSYRVVADGCIDLIMDTEEFNGMLVAGVADSAFDIPLNGIISYFGIRFLPGGINQFFQFPVSGIANQMTAAENIVDKKLATLSFLLFEDKKITKRIETAESFLLTRMMQQDASMHPRLAAALHYILSGNGNTPIEKKAAEWISPRQLRRLFHDHIGCSPKLFSRIVRFQKTLQSMQHGQGTERHNAFYDHGYFDQAHFIKEFKVFYGQTPSSLYTPPEK